jgi:WD40 repeat protein
MGSLLGIGFSPDGNLIAASDTNFQIKIWSVADSTEIALLTGHQAWVWDAIFSPDGRYLASGSSDRTLRIWDVRSGECLQILTAHTDWVWKVGFVWSSQLVFSLGADRQIKLWWWQTGTSFISLTVPDTGLRDGAFHGRGLLATCAYDRINIWYLWTARKLHTIEMAGDLRIKKVTFSHDGRLVIGISTSLTIYAWDVDSGELRLTLSGHPSQVNEVQTLDTGEIITTCLEQVRVWNGETGQCLQAINFAGQATISIGYYFHRSRRLLATGSDNGAISIWNLETGKCTHSTSGTAPRAIALATNPCNAIVATGRDDGTIHLWNFDRLEPSLAPPAIVIPAHLGNIWRLAFSPNGKLVASTGGDRLVRVWDAETGANLHEFSGYTDYIADLQFADDRTLLTRSYNSPLRQWDLDLDRSQILDCLRDRWILGFTISPDRQWLALGSNSPSLTLWHRSTGETIEQPIAGNRLRRFLYSADGRQLVGITDDGTLNLWDLERDYSHRAWQISPQEIRALAFVPDRSDRLIVAGDTGEISVWDLQQQQCLASNNAHQLPVAAIGILPDRRLVSCGVDATIRLWELAERNLLEVGAIEFSKPYQGMKITDVKGLNRSQLATLVRLGALL